MLEPRLAEQGFLTLIERAKQPISFCMDKLVGKNVLMSCRARESSPRVPCDNCEDQSCQCPICREAALTAQLSNQPGNPPGQSEPTALPTISSCKYRVRM